VCRWWRELSPAVMQFYTSEQRQLLFGTALDELQTKCVSTNVGCSLLKSRMSADCPDSRVRRFIHCYNTEQAGLPDEMCPGTLVRCWSELLCVYSLVFTHKRRCYLQFYRLPRGVQSAPRHTVSPLKLCNLAKEGERFQVFTTTSMKMTVLWDVEQCSLVSIGRR
jgi:hypothetical protein